MNLYHRWIQGMRSHRANAHTDWREVLFGRLRADYSHIPQGEKTVEAERGLDFRASAYYFIGRCEPAFGDSALQFDASPCELGLISPFDTGGVWFEHIPMDPPLPTAAEKREVVAVQSEPFPLMEPRFSEWVEESFESPSQYVIGERPTSAYCANVELVACDSRGWVWEARVARDELRQARLEPVTLVLEARRYEAYLKWVVANPKLSTAEKSRHISLVSKIHSDPSGSAAGLWLNEKVATDAT